MPVFLEVKSFIFLLNAILTWRFCFIISFILMPYSLIMFQVFESLYLLHFLRFFCRCVLVLILLFLLHKRTLVFLVLILMFSSLNSVSSIQLIILCDSSLFLVITALSSANYNIYIILPFCFIPKCIYCLIFR